MGHFADWYSMFVGRCQATLRFRGLSAGNPASGSQRGFLACGGRRHSGRPCRGLRVGQASTMHAIFVLTLFDLMVEVEKHVAKHGLVGQTVRAISCLRCQMLPRSFTGMHGLVALQASCFRSPLLTCGPKLGHAGTTTQHETLTDQPEQVQGMLV